MESVTPTTEEGEFNLKLSKGVALPVLCPPAEQQTPRAPESPHSTVYVPPQKKHPWAAGRNSANSGPFCGTQDDSTEQLQLKMFPPSSSAPWAVPYSQNHPPARAPALPCSPLPFGASRELLEVTGAGGGGAGKTLKEGVEDTGEGQGTGQSQTLQGIQATWEQEGSL